MVCMLQYSTDYPKTEKEEGRTEKGERRREKGERRREGGFGWETGGWRQVQGIIIGYWFQQRSELFRLVAISAE